VALGRRSDVTQGRTSLLASAALASTGSEIDHHSTKQISQTLVSGESISASGSQVAAGLNEIIESRAIDATIIRFVRYPVHEEHDCSNPPGFVK
jgi:hypothetical protein